MGGMNWGRVAGISRRVGIAEISTRHEVLRLRPSAGLAALLGAIFRGGLPALSVAPVFFMAKLLRSASIKLITCACSCAGGDTISSPATFASISFVSFSVYTSLYL